MPGTRPRGRRVPCSLPCTPPSNSPARERHRSPPRRAQPASWSPAGLDETRDRRLGARDQLLSSDSERWQMREAIDGDAGALGERIQHQNEARIPGQDRLVDGKEALVAGLELLEGLELLLRNAALAHLAKLLLEVSAAAEELDSCPPPITKAGHAARRAQVPERLPERLHVGLGNCCGCLPNLGLKVHLADGRLFMV